MTTIYKGAANLKKIHYNISRENKTEFRNNALFCIGTGRMNLALRHEYHKQLEMVQQDIHFSYIRGHGLFCDDMAIYQTYLENGIEKTEYNFTYVDLVFDDYLSLGLKPFVELGFMPYKLASGDQTIFYWKGNVTPPKDYLRWAELVTAAVRHWIARYGREEVITWPFEVWNEPNLPGFWKGADMEEYFKLYDITARAVKECDSAIRVGGPAICGVDDERWLSRFLQFCSESKAPLDFVTRHAYATEMPEHAGHYAYQKLRAPEVFLDELKVSRRIIDSFPQYYGMEMHITEFNTSYTPLNPIHDTNLNAAYVARLLSEMGDVCASYSYWTFGDVFEESGVAFTPFSGCFGLLTNGMIPKPTYWTFVFFSRLTGEAIGRGDHYVLTKNDDNSLRGIVWNPVEETSEDDIVIGLSITVEDGEYVLVQKRVDEMSCNPLKTWIDLGAPANPDQSRMELLKESAHPIVSTDRLKVTGGTLDLEFKLSSNAVCYFELQKIIPKYDRGFLPERIRGAEKRS